MTIKKLGKLYAVGIGPGDSELLTLKAVRLLKTAPIVAFPEKNAGKRDSFAWDIVTKAIAPTEFAGRTCFLHFPMTRDSATNLAAWQAGAQKLAAYLKDGKDVVFATQGDPSVYSTWGYIYAQVNLLIKSLEVEIVPAVTSLTAVPAISQIALADGKERFCVVPATYGIECLDRLVVEFDTIMLIKAGRNLEALIAKLTKLDLLDKACYVAHATGEKQRIYYDLRQVPKGHCYFSMVQISIRKRQGILAGQNG